MRYSWRMGFLCAHRSWTSGWCAVLLLFSASVDAARATSDSAAAPLLPPPFRDAIERGVANGAYRGLAIGVIDGKQRGTFYFGHRDSVDSPAPDGDSAFEIGAASEIFTGLLLARAAVEGKIRLSDPIEKFLPAPFPFTDARVGKITLAQLATQRSGLPSQPPNLFPSNLDDPYADYGAVDLLGLLALHRAGAAQDDAAFGYSILNAGLLGHLLARIYQMPLTEAVAANVIAPLGLQRTTYADETTLLPGHAHGQRAPHWHYGALAGAAGLRASLPDLLAFLQSNLTPDASPLRAALLLARQPRAAGATDQVGLGWNVRETLDGKATWPLVWRASVTGGFASFIGFRTDRQKAIVLLGNAAEDVAALGIAWLGDALPPQAPRGAGAGNDNRVDEYPGLYEISTGVDAIVRVDGNALSLQMPGQPPVRLRAADKDVFVADSGLLGATFMRNIDDVSGLMLHIGGNNVTATRLSARAPRLARAPVPVGEAARNSLLGDYRFFDDATWIRIGEAGQNLSLQWTMGERRSMFAYAPDRYADADGAIDLHVMRDDHGRVVGLLLDLAGTKRAAVPLRGSSPEKYP